MPGVPARLPRRPPAPLPSRTAAPAPHGPLARPPLRRAPVSPRPGSRPRRRSQPARSPRAPPSLLRSWNGSPTDVMLPAGAREALRLGDGLGTVGTVSEAATLLA